MILNSKLAAPMPRARAVARPHLINLMNAGLSEEQRKLTLLVAPAGFGKSTLVAMWLDQLDRPHSWISLDRGDSMAVFADLDDNTFVLIDRA